MLRPARSTALRGSPEGARPGVAVALVTPGRHRFAPNLLWLPAGLLFGRLEPTGAVELVRELRSDRLPLQCFRGRSTFPPEAQMAEVAVRSRSGITGLREVALVSAANGRVRLATPHGEVEATVEARLGPTIPASCGATPEPVEGYVVARIDA